jgi:hypothetical protein
MEIRLVRMHLAEVGEYDCTDLVLGAVSASRSCEILRSTISVVAGQTSRDLDWPAFWSPRESKNLMYRNPNLALRDQRRKVH